MAASFALSPLFYCYCSHNSSLLSSSSSSFRRSRLSIPLLLTHPPLLPTTTTSRSRRILPLSVGALTLDLSGGSFFERRSRGGGDGMEEGDMAGIRLGLGGDGPSASSAAATAALEDKEESQCPPPPPSTRPWQCSAPTWPKMNASPSPKDTKRQIRVGVSHYVIRRLHSVERMEADPCSYPEMWDVTEVACCGGGMYVEVFNRGVIPLACAIMKKNKAGKTNNYLDGIYLLFFYFTKPESMGTLESGLKADDDVIRFSSFKIRKRKY